MTTRPGGRDEVLLAGPLVRGTDIVPAVEDRSYLVFIAGALLAAIGGGFLLGVLVSLSEAGAFLEDRSPWLIQAHGWAQLEGWGGLFVAGMGFRLLPRFAGRRPLPRRANLAVFALLFAGVVVRTFAQAGDGGRASAAGVLLGLVLWGTGALAFSLVLAWTLARGRGRGQPWHAFAAAGAAWWGAWAIAGVAAGVRGARNDAYVPSTLDDALTWVAMLGAIGNFIWAVQSRSVPIFFGRRTPPLRRVIVPGVLLNTGVALLYTAAWLDEGGTRERLVGAGFVMSGVALAWLAPVAGSCWGKATRLRPRARAAARFVLLANEMAVLSGVLLAWAGARTLADGGFAAEGVRDAARHAFGAGVLTLLIVGMAQLVAPFFALQRVEPRSVWLLDHGVFWLLAAAAMLRVAAGLLLGHVATEGRMQMAAAAGTLAWLGLVVFAFAVARAVRGESAAKAAIAAAAARPGG
ncbi:MAG: hypothetical protein HYX53_06535 [Chloroflexi bacterium]|nr:hypothetical protein [Chloroflexota bacterium]